MLLTAQFGNLSRKEEKKHIMQMIYSHSNNAIQGPKSCSCHILEVALVMLEFSLDRNLVSARENMTYETVNSLPS